MIGGLIINSYTKWSATLADITSAGWVAISEGLVRTFTYKVPIWAVLIIVALVAVSWYAVRIIRRATNITAPNTAFKFLNYREDVIDGVLCRWDYKQPYHRTQFRIENLLCYCRHCDFIIGRPNHHEQKCPSCSRRAVRSDNSPFYTNNILREEIAGYKRREDAMPFENFIRLEIDRRVRTEGWSKPVKAEGT